MKTIIILFLFTLLPLSSYTDDIIGEWIWSETIWQAYVGVITFRDDNTFTMRTEASPGRQVITDGVFILKKGDLFHTLILQETTTAVIPETKKEKPYTYKTTSTHTFILPVISIDELGFALFDKNNKLIATFLINKPGS